MGEWGESGRRGEGGFTLVELLVVMLIVGALAAIAVPAFFGQRDKARDAEAKAGLSAAQIAAETYAVDNDGSYGGMTATSLAAIETTLGDVVLEVLSAGNDDYDLRVTSDSGSTFTLGRAGGAIVRGCAPAGTGGCAPGGEW